MGIASKFVGDGAVPAGVDASFGQGRGQAVQDARRMFCN